MTDWTRLSDYIIDYFPEPTYSRKDIKDWAMENVPAWKYMGGKDKREVLNDWEDFVTPEIEAKIPRFFARIKKFFRRLF